MRKNTPEKFWAKVATPNASGCRPWLGCRLPTGYGVVGWAARQQGAHRVAWMLSRGPIPPGEFVLHRCDNPPCCNPDHLFLGSHAENMADMAAKGRAARHGKATGDRHGSRTMPHRVPRGCRHGSVTTPESVRRGERHPMARLSEADAAAIRAARGMERQVDIAARFGVSQVLVSKIQRGVIWRLIPAPG